MDENRIWILEGLMIGFLVSQVTIVLLYHNYSDIPKCTPELISKSNMYLFIFTASGIISFSCALYLKREKTVLIELFVFVVGMFVILSETFCV